MLMKPSHVSLSWTVKNTTHKYRSPWPTISAWMTSTFLLLHLYVKMSKSFRHK
jgi:hypothetical protein